VIGALLSPSIGDALPKNVLRVTFGGPDCSIVGVGAKTSSDSFVIPLIPKNTIIITTDAITAPIPIDGP
jgi:hypothetical protein